MPMAQKLDVLIRLLTSAQAAEMLGVDPFTLARWRAEGRSPQYIRLSDSPKGRVMYRREALERWIEAHTCTSTSSETEARRIAGKG